MPSTLVDGFTDPPAFVVTPAEPSITVLIFYPSYMIFTLPASKVFVPFTVVMRILSNVPEMVIPPEAYCIRELPDKTLDEVNPLELFCEQIITLPNKTPAAAISLVQINPAVDVAIAVPEPYVEAAVLVYPDVVTEPLPN